jgi:uncharacterized protein (DUF433 family)
MPFQTVFDCLKAGHPLSEFLEDFPTVSREQTVAALEQAGRALSELCGKGGPAAGGHGE